jgi:hypothetical protein
MVFPSNNNHMMIAIKSVIPVTSQALIDQLAQSEEEIATIEELIKNNKTLARTSALHIAQARKDWLEFCKKTSGQFTPFFKEFRLGRKRRRVVFRHDGLHWLYEDRKFGLKHETDLFTLVKWVFMRL